jgi:molybdopterin synthase sulfur carrier subunit
MNLNVLFFAAARDAVGTDNVTVDLPDGSTVGELQQLMIQRTPQLERWSQALLWAVNNRYAGCDQVLHASDVIACFPPVSGG